MKRYNGQRTEDKTRRNSDSESDMMRRQRAAYTDEDANFFREEGSGGERKPA